MNRILAAIVVSVVMLAAGYATGWRMRGNADAAAEAIAKQERERKQAEVEEQQRETERGFERERKRANDALLDALRESQRVRVLPPIPGAGARASAGKPNGSNRADISRTYLADLERRFRTARQQSIELAGEADRCAQQLGALERWIADATEQGKLK